MSEIACPVCLSPIPPALVDEKTDTASCPECRHVHMVHSVPSDRLKLRRDVPLAKGMTVEERGKRLYITYRDSTFMRFITLCIMVYSAFTFGLVAYHMLQKRELAAMGIISAGVALIIIGVCYYTLALIVNSTKVVVGGTHILVFSSPLPLPGSRREIAAKDVDQLYAAQTSHVNNGTHYYRYEVWIRYDGLEQSLVTGLQDPQLALALEAEIERYIGVEDREIRGSYRG